MPSRSKKNQAKRLRIKALIEGAEPTHKYLGTDQWGFAHFQVKADA